MNASAKMMKNDAYEYLSDIMTEYVDEIVARGILNYAFKKACMENINITDDGIPGPLIEKILRGVDMYVDNGDQKENCKKRLGGCVGRNIFSPQRDGKNIKMDAVNH